MTAIRQCVVSLAFDGLTVLGHVELVDKPLHTKAAWWSWKRFGATSVAAHRCPVPRASCALGLLPSEARELKQLREENARLKRVLAVLTLDKVLVRTAARRQKKER